MAGLAFLVLLLGCETAEPVRSAFQVDEAPALPSGQPLFVMACVGDTHGRAQLEDYGDVDPLAGVDHLFGTQDLFLFNHEGMLLDPLPPPGSCTNTIYLLASRPEIADYFERAPLNVATLANNHILDCFGDGLVQTVEALEARGIRTVGAGRDIQEACRPLELRVNGVDCAFLSYLAMDQPQMMAGAASAGSASWETCDGAGQVAALEAAGRFVVVALHLHLDEGWTEVTGPQHRALAEEVLDAGADLVVGHGSHVPQGILVRGGRVALLSLGNFLFNLGVYTTPSSSRSVFVDVAVHADQLVITLRPVQLDGSGRPQRTSTADGLRILDDIARLSAGFGTNIRIWQNTGYLVVDRNP